MYLQLTILPRSYDEQSLFMIICLDIYMCYIVARDWLQTLYILNIIK